MRVFAVLIASLPIVWRAGCAPNIPKAGAISTSAASIAATVPQELYCETICAGGCGGRPHYDTHKQVCRCTITEHIDDGDMELIQKTANIISMKIKFYDVTKVKRSLDDSSQENASDDDDRDEVDKPEKVASSGEATAKRVPASKKFPFAPMPLRPLFGDLTARLQKPQEAAETPGENDRMDAILGQIDPILADIEPHYNIYAASPRPGKQLFGGPILGQINPSIKGIEPHHNVYAGYPALPVPPISGYPAHLTPALTRSLLINVREKLDNLLLRTQQYPYQPAVTAHETESMRNTLKQITQVNVNVRPEITTWGYFFNNLVNQLVPVLKAEAPNSTFAEGTNTKPDAIEDVTPFNIDVLSTVTPQSIRSEYKDHHKKSEVRHHKIGKVPIELGKKTSIKPPTLIKILPTDTTTEVLPSVFDKVPTPSTLVIPTITATSIKEVPVEILKVVTITVTPNQEQVPLTSTLAPIDQIFTTSTSIVQKQKTEGTTPKFLPVEDGDDLIGESEEYLYDDDHEHNLR